MRRDDLHARHARKSAHPMIDYRCVPVSDAEALDAIGRKAALRHWLTEPCPDCETWALRRDGHSPNVCPRCENHRWVPAKGVWIDEEINRHIDEIELAFIVPLSMLEGDGQ